MLGPFFMIRNRDTPSCREPPAIGTDVEGKYFGYFEGRAGEQWVFMYDRVDQTGELRGGNLGWDTVLPVRDGRDSLVPGEGKALWLRACWTAAAETA